MGKIKLIVLLLLLSCTGYSQEFVLLGWNDLGMHCSNKYFDKIAVLPPYNNLFAQLIIKNPWQMPQVVTNGYKIEYLIPGNTYSVGKTDFWTYAQVLLGLPQPLPNNIGLTGRGLTGQMDTANNYFSAHGIPVTPYADIDLINERPFQMFRLNARFIANNTIVQYTENVIPVSNEIGCVQSGCHTSEQQIKNQHALVPGYDPNAPTLCASCHASNALGTTGDPEARPFSYRIHIQHDEIFPPGEITTCYKCHPGPVTQCFRDPMRQVHNMTCQDCHGTMNQVAISIIPGGRRNWLDEPKCGTCHGSNFAEQPGKLFRESKGHGGLFCSACHGSPHAVLPSREANDNAQTIRYTGIAGAIKKCDLCHSFNPSAPGPHGLQWLGIKPTGNEVPDGFKLYQNYPNPFNSSTIIRMAIPKQAFVTLKIYDVLGKEIETMAEQELKPGNYEMKFVADKLTSGIYYYKLFSKDFIQTNKMILVK
jgi:hypothetical protein